MWLHTSSSWRQAAAPDSSVEWTTRCSLLWSLCIGLPWETGPQFQMLDCFSWQCFSSNIFRLKFFICLRSFSFSRWIGIIRRQTAKVICWRTFFSPVFRTLSSELLVLQHDREVLLVNSPPTQMRASEGGVMSKIGHLTDSLWCELRTKDPAMGGGLVQKSENTVSQIQKLPFIREKVHNKNCPSAPWTDRVDNGKWENIWCVCVVQSAKLENKLKRRKI